MDIRRFFFKREKKDAEKSWEERLHEARMESLRKKTQVSDEIIGMMNDFPIERRIDTTPFNGSERRHA